MTYSFRIALGRSIILALILLGGSGTGFAQDAREQLTVALSMPGKPGFLEVSLVNGSIHVTGYSGREVAIDAAARTGKHGDSGPSLVMGLKRISAGNSLNLTAEEKNNHVEISTESWKGPIDLAIKVPRNFSLKVSTVNDGDIVVDNVAGELEVTNVNGNISLNQVAGSAVANTVNGDLKASFTSITAGAPMAFSTLNGKVDVTLPASASAALKMKSDRGNVYSDFDVALSKGQPKVTRTSQNGLSRLSTDDWTYGKINSGGAEMMMKTFNGDIFLRKAK
ncbi:DUF4097 family beta strand repeat-containing protein [Hymenobacter terricola]|uniref:DUF4097 family beta strand repeat-containing protein n=1 Tax=Hymenobacter terricola TaxID=2819236 RepID=UPI001B31633C|nr:DUF4097 family beta strand repeat-containing protein [Hymenobacter terricola]